MKRTKSISIAVAIGFACITPLALFAEDQNPNKADKKEAAEAHHKNKSAMQGKVTPQFNKQVQQGGKAPDKFTATQHSKIVNQGAAVNQQSVQQQTTRRQFQQTQQTQTSQNFAVQGTRSNHYGGRWFAANMHSDWDRGSVHFWNHHHYRWYDGGWIIIDAGPSVAYYRSGGSVASRVQERLAQQGYYNGPIDGDIGPGSRNAIANYQADHGLPVTGHIDEPLLSSLGLQ